MSLTILFTYLTLSFCLGAHIETSACEPLAGRSEAVGDVASVQSGMWTELTLEGCEGGLYTAAATSVRRLLVRNCDALTPEAFSTLRSLADLTLHSDHFRSARYPIFCRNNKLINLTIVETTFGSEPDGHFVKNLTQMCNKLKVLTLNKLEITKVRENDFVNAVALTSLDLGSNSIETVEGESFKKLNNLRYLSLFDNQLSSLSINAFTGLGCLEILRLDQNNLLTIPNHVFDSLQHLKELIVSGNNLQHVQRPLFENIKTIEKLSLAVNDIRNVDQFTFRNFQNLKTLDLSENNIDELSVDIFAGLSKLEFLHLQNNNIKNIQPRAFAPLSTMKLLDLSMNSLETLSGDPFGVNNSALISLNLADNNMRNLQPRCFAALVNLVELNISHNHLETFSDDLLGSGSSLDSLDVSHNRLSRLGGVRASTLRVDHNRLSVWGGWARVRAVALHHNPWQCACARAIRSELRARRVALLDAPPLDGKVPQCVVLPTDDGCLHEPHNLPGYEEIIDSFIQQSYPTKTVN